MLSARACVYSYSLNREYAATLPPNIVVVRSSVYARALSGKLASSRALSCPTATANVATCDTHAVAFAFMYVPGAYSTVF